MKQLLLCKLLNHHNWSNERFANSPHKRYCSHCQAEESLVYRTYPKIGEPAVFWKRYHWLPKVKKEKDSK